MRPVNQKGVFFTQTASVWSLLSGPYEPGLFDSVPADSSCHNHESTIVWTAFIHNQTIQVDGALELQEYFRQPTVSISSIFGLRLRFRPYLTYTQPTPTKAAAVM